MAMKTNRPDERRNRDAGSSYRGVKLQRPFGSPRTPLNKLRDAVRAAVAKNYDTLAHGK
jgi:hypothetical protein